ncbi:MAG: hypothetical protein HYY32_03215 [Chloroflexi bacterium]|nr:hypothetical protein [Chloroflexota bacterium]
METLYGYAGKLLRVDLSSGKISDEPLDPNTARKFAGGTGIGAKYLYDEVPAGVEWSDAANRLIVATGPLGGTTIGGTGTISVVSKGPLSNGSAATQANGFFGAFLKFSGYDGIILQGQSRKWVYLYIHDGKAELKDASGLLGKDTVETEDAVKSELNYPEKQMSVMSIGPAGENLVRYAAMVVDKGHVASHNGVGAVMGSKKLKAIAVARGKIPVPLKDKDRVNAIGKQFMDNLIAANDNHYKWGTLSTLYDRTIAKDGLVPVKNYTTCIFEIEPEKLEKFGGPYIRGHFEPKPTPCWACRMRHCHTLTITEGPFKGYVGEEPEYECLAACGPVIGNTDATAAIVLSNDIDRAGLDVNETGWTLGLAIECFEKGVLTTKDTDGLELRWGNYEAARQMVKKIARREGLGDVLAEGAMRAAQRIGGDAPQFAIHTMKGVSPKGHDHRNRWPKLFDTCLTQIATDEGYSMNNPADLGLPAKPSEKHNNSPEDTLAWNSLFKGSNHFEDSLGICKFISRQDVKLLAEGFSAATGWDVTPAEGMEIGRRAVHLLRAFNVRHGHTAEMDAPSPRYGSAPVDGPSKGKTIMTYWNELRSKYYENMGWDSKTGKPLPETLKRAGLEYAVPELWGK